MAELTVQQIVRNLANDLADPPVLTDEQISVLIQINTLNNKVDLVRVASEYCRASALKNPGQSQARTKEFLIKADQLEAHYRNQFYGTRFIVDADDPTIAIHTEGLTRDQVLALILQSDWDETDTNSKAFIKNKPSSVGGGGQGGLNQAAVDNRVKAFTGQTSETGDIADDRISEGIKYSDSKVDARLPSWVKSGTVPLNKIPGDIARDTELTNRISDHNQATNVHDAIRARITALEGSGVSASDVDAKIKSHNDADNVHDAIRDRITDLEGEFDYPSIEIYPKAIPTVADLDRDYTLTLSGDTVHIPKNTNELEIWVENEAVETISNYVPATSPKIFSFNVNTSEETTIGLASDATEALIRLVFRERSGGSSTYIDELTTILGIGQAALLPPSGGGEVTTAQLEAEIKARIEGDDANSTTIKNNAELVSFIASQEISDNPSYVLFTAALTDVLNSGTAQERRINYKENTLYYFPPKVRIGKEVPLPEVAEGGGGGAGTGMAERVLNVTNGMTLANSFNGNNIGSFDVKGEENELVEIILVGTGPVSPIASVASINLSLASNINTNLSNANVEMITQSQTALRLTIDRQSVSRAEHGTLWFHNAATQTFYVLAGKGNREAFSQADTIPQVEVYVVRSGSGGGGGGATALTTQQELGLVDFNTDPSTIGVPSDAVGKTTAITRSVDILVSNSDLVTGDVWYEVEAQGQPLVSRTKWTSTLNTITVPISSNVATAIINNLSDKTSFDLRLKFYDVASGGSEIDIIRLAVALAQFERSPMVLQAAVNGANDAGVKSVTLPANYEEWGDVFIAVWERQENRSRIVSIPTAYLAAQTTAIDIREGGAQVDWTKATRVIIATGGRGSSGSGTTGGNTIIYAVLR